MGDVFIIFAAVPYPRDFNARHDLREILFIAFFVFDAVRSRSCVEMGQLGKTSRLLLRTIRHSSTGCRATTLSPVCSGPRPDRSRSVHPLHGGLWSGACVPVAACPFWRRWQEPKQPMPRAAPNAGDDGLRVGHADAHDARPTQLWRGRRSGSRDRASSTGVAQRRVVTADACHCDRRTVATVSSGAGTRHRPRPHQRKSIRRSQPLLVELGPGRYG